MPFTAEQLEYGGYAAIDYHLRIKPIDQYNTDRPWLNKLMAGKRSYPGGKEHITEPVRYTNDSNFQWYFGSQSVTYNQKRTKKRTAWPWRGCHDGFLLDEDELAQNGITISAGEGRPVSASESEKVQLLNLLEDNTETLRLGFDEKFDSNLHQDGTQSADALVGLDLLVATDPTSGVVGGIDRATNVWWRNHASTGIAAGNLVGVMEQYWRNCIRNGGAPDFILAGSNFVDTFRTQVKSEISRYEVQQVKHTTPTELDPSIKVDKTFTGLHFQGVPILWDPVFLDLDTELSPVIAWEDRCYFLNCRHIKLRPISGHDMVTRRPNREPNRYVFYFGLTWKGAITLNRSNAHAVLSIA